MTRLREAATKTVCITISKPCSAEIQAKAEKRKCAKVITKAVARFRSYAGMTRIRFKGPAHRHLSIVTMPPSEWHELRAKRGGCQRLWLIRREWTGTLPGAGCRSRTAHGLQVRSHRRSPPRFAAPVAVAAQCRSGKLIGDATRQALVRIVDLCLEEHVDALIIAGDLYDGEQTSMKTARFLASQMQRLSDAGIAVFKIRGNHDALSKITQELVLPPSVKIFSGRAEAVELSRGDQSVAIHGLSFAKPQAPESLLPKFKAPVAGAVNIGIMHTSLAGAPGHDAYAPCAVADLHASGFDYWALGPSITRTHHRGKKR